MPMASARRHRVSHDWRRSQRSRQLATASDLAPAVPCRLHAFGAVPFARVEAELREALGGAHAELAPRLVAVSAAALNAMGGFHALSRRV